MKTNRFSGVVAVLLVLLAGCAGLHADESSTVETPKRVELSSGDSRSMNYTPWYIHTFSISGRTEQESVVEVGTCGRWKRTVIQGIPEANAVRATPENGSLT
ncbi:DUF3304 domain-containing protein [Burkholderia multivorans]|uniref:DUF3304 domain-containing protein n=1 Tax=Burkholderia multivorans TaxID=87883 RepID=UPI0020B1BA2F|nr:DUF3304 domain-containing protein [Burkholderia multivorans]